MNASKELARASIVMQAVKLADLIRELSAEISTSNSRIQKKEGAELLRSKFYADYVDSFSPSLEYLLIENYTLIDDPNDDFQIMSNVNHLHNTTVIFHNCNLRGIQISNCDIKGLIFSSCDIADEISFQDDTKIRALIFDSETRVQTVTLEKGTLDYISVRNASRTSGISVRRNGYCKTISIIESSGGYIFIAGATADEISVSFESEVSSIDIAYGSSVKKISLDSTSKAGAIYIRYKSIVDEIKIRANSTVDNIEFLRLSSCGAIEIRENSCVNRLKIKLASLLFQLNVLSSRLTFVEMSHNYGSIRLLNSTISLMNLDNCRIPVFEWRSGTKAEVNIYRSHINHLSLCNTIISKEGTLVIHGCSIFIVQLQELVVHGSLFLRQISALPEPFAWQPPLKGLIKKNETDKISSALLTIWEEKFALWEENYRNMFNGLENEFVAGERPLFRIADSSLGKSEITGSDLQPYYFEFRNSKILEMFIMGNTLPKDNIHIYASKHSRIVEYEQKSSIYEQLKRLHESQGNMVEATWYHSRAMKNQENLAESIYRNSKGQKIIDKLTRWLDFKGYKLNYASNNHGENWPRALIFTILISISIYALYYISLFYKHPFSPNEIWAFLGDYFSFLDPTHKADFLLPREEHNFLSKLLDFCGKILVGYGLYQLISAFRRHGRRT